MEQVEIKTISMSGLRNLCKIYGRLTVKGSNGKEVEYIWDYSKDEPRTKSEMTKEEIAESEKSIIYWFTYLFFE